MLTRVHQAFRSELVKLLRPRLLWPLLGSVAAATAAVAAGTAALRNDPGPVDLLGAARTATPLIGLVMMCVAANAFCQEYREGTWRNLLVRQPARGALATGKLAGLALLSLLVAATVWATCAATTTLTAARHGSPPHWDGAPSTTLRLLAAMPAYTVLGSAAGLLLRSTAAALGTVLGWTLVAESALTALAATKGWDISPWLPASAVTRLSAAPSPTLPTLTTLTTTAWCTLLFTTATHHFTRTPHL
ncbi:ABC transporter permease [Kitasatospora sp. NPDC057518]|uniref:ABC transporter permease n=1 Tax=Kitasatospora sp. NPDC057518 TaxID=3346155 RepID=UPI0036805F8C